MSTPVEPDAQVQAWCHDLARHGEHEPRIAALGSAAIAGLRAVLAAPPEAVNAARLFAVSMLARLPQDAARSALRETLYHPALHTLAPPIAEAERAVKSAALDALARRDGAAVEQDLAWALHTARLPQAAVLAGRLHLHALAPMLAQDLDDDVLAMPASDALAAMPAVALPALSTLLPQWLAATGQMRARRAALRALRLYAALGACPALADWRRAWHADVPALRAAAALCALPAHTRPALLGALLEGALLPDAALADACRSALQAQPRWPLHLLFVALRLLRHGVPDAYGDRQSLARAARVWLGASLLDHVGAHRPQLLQRLPAELIAAGLAGGATLDAAQRRALHAHPQTARLRPPR